MYNCPKLTLPLIGYTFKRFENVTNDYRWSGRIPSRASIGNPNDTGIQNVELGKTATITYPTPPNAPCTKLEHLVGKLHNVGHDSEEATNSLGTVEDSRGNICTSLFETFTLNTLSNFKPMLSDVPQSTQMISNKAEGEAYQSQPKEAQPCAPTLWERSALAFQASHPNVCMSLNLNLSRSFGFDILISDYHSGDPWCNYLATFFKELKRDRTLATKALELRDQIVSVVLTLDEQLGLALGSQVWCCVYTLLEVSLIYFQLNPYLLRSTRFMMFSSEGTINNLQ